MRRRFRDGRKFYIDWNNQDNMEERTINLLDIYRKLKIIEQSMVTKEELDRVLESAIIFSNEDTMRQIEESEKDIKSGKVKKINSVKDIE